jgi:hypothetical protein
MQFKDTKVCPDDQTLEACDERGWVTNSDDEVDARRGDEMVVVMNGTDGEYRVCR